MLFCLFLLPARSRAEGELLETNSDSPYVHRISLYNDEGVVISPSDEDSAEPYSVKRTCGKCHDYSAVSGGWHFNASFENVEHGRPGEPWILNDYKTGTQLPVSYRGWPGVYHPGELKMSAWDFVLRFGRHLPGGGPGEKRENLREDPQARWDVSGDLEIDCLCCHSGGQRHDQSARAAEMERQNLKWVPVVTAGLAVVRGAAKDAEEADPFAAFDPAFEDEGGGSAADLKVIYDLNRFDPDERVFIDILKKGTDDSCYFCHTIRSASHEGGSTEDLGLTLTDVHLSAGLKCADCHRNEIGHATVRGYEGENYTGGQPFPEAYSCRGCHYGVEPEPEGSAQAQGGNYGAPYPEHVGFPPLHFEELTCTTCHSGPKPGKHPYGIQTSMAHGLGLSEQFRRDDVPPFIVEPVFVQQEDGLIAPHRMMWPAFWGWMDDRGVEPLKPEEVEELAGDAFGKNEVKRRDWKQLEEETVASVLKELGQVNDASKAVYISGGRLHRLDENEELIGVEHEAAAPYSWPLAHNVRPAAQSLGSEGCTECHSVDAEFFFGEVIASGPASLGEPLRVPMYEYEQLEPILQKAWGLSFITRPLFKIFGIAVVSFLALIVLLYILVGLKRVLETISGE